MPFDEKRKFTRILFETTIKVTSGKTVIVSNRLRDISLGGAFLFTSETSLPANTSCILEIDLIGRASLLRIQIEAEVVRVDEEGMAVRFTKIDLDSLVHLRHLIRVHAQDPRAMDAEYDTALLELDTD
jgi:c-di-GMP-binding flagellar brake protein YcgR